MANVTQIQDLILISTAYQLELGNQLYAEQKKGCIDCFDASLIERLEWLSDSLSNQVDINDYGEETNRLYACLLSAVGNYSGASLTVDGNASVPNTIIIVEGGTGVTLPYWQDVYWSEMTNDVNGYRDTFYKSEWIGWNPMIQIPGVVEYILGEDYTSDGNGTIVFKEGKGFYDGGRFRAGNFQPYTPSPSTDRHYVEVGYVQDDANGISLYVY